MGIWIYLVHDLKSVSAYGELTASSPAHSCIAGEAEDTDSTRCKPQSSFSPDPIVSTRDNGLFTPEIYVGHCNTTALEPSCCLQMAPIPRRAAEVSWCFPFLYSLTV